MMNSLLSEVDRGEVDSKGVRRICMTTDARSEIFLLYSRLKKEYDNKVVGPSRSVSEEEFWAKYFQKLKHDSRLSKAGYAIRL